MVPDALRSEQRGQNMTKEDVGTPSPAEPCWTTYYSKLGHPDGAKCELPFGHTGGHEGRDGSGQRRKWLVVRKSLQQQ
jgi:hypothetical protein